MICSRIVNFDCKEAGLTSKFGQQFIGAVKTSLTTSYDDVQRRTTSPKNLLHGKQAGRTTEYGLCSKVALAKERKKELRMFMFSFFSNCFFVLR